ncbi:MULTISPECIES: serine--tRNA ligase [Corynebacterium]|uniref:Serine--tRNA ligase n=1 Tax=Corynebacterium lipophiloflavum (strain ATCC 700352 / DSM 44291 / CCUG 37336 / JCM 10383 / DMMZ 1944) TaxID=525263 RepID=C0XNN7_CORLD|nr:MULTISPECIES: serine--tRNA ligase [Corynebacterium]EEI18146.1 serine--tRNA ligase [Corynebacterium lipophiloflavum DSM 44291]MCT1695950.1 serine--tRNA ligase [Corynebacterium sanguinis]MCT1715358.1 serine--tRNA ligase [Corynebacterium sanguinis]MCT1806152.1 serine--tRNA ligase [Corynebacterium sanguinis]MCT1882178.1 serine--tRNA ligase [Corynebacterium sanguinis]
MIDLKFLRENADVVRESQRARGEDPQLVDQLLEADERRRSSIQAADELRSEQKAFGKKIGQAAPEDRPALLEGSNELKARVKEAEAAQDEAEEAVAKLQLRIANVVEGAPAGGEEDFVVIEHVGEIPEFDFEVRDHLDLGEALGIIDMKRGTKVGGARFYYLVGDGAWLQLGMLMLAAQKAREAGFTVVIPPVLVRPDIMAGTGFLDAHDEEIYYLERDDMYLVGTSEVALAGYHSGEIIDLSDGPLLYAGWSSCFRREAGSYGKDTKGILRVHQFDKLEMFVYCAPEDAEEMHRKLLQLERDMLSAVEVPYRIIDVAAGDLGSSAARKFDTEAWVPSQNTYRELTSTSNCTTFQARRLATRYRDASGKTQTAATLNGTLATTRWLVAILENNQRADGSVVVPEALRPWVGKDVLEVQQ